MKIKGAKVQVKHIPDQAMLDLIKALCQAPYLILYNRGFERYDSQTAILWDLQKMWSNVPPNLILAKLRNLEKRGLIDGCTCGCRGSFTVIEEKV